MDSELIGKTIVAVSENYDTYGATLLRFDDGSCALLEPRGYEADEIATTYYTPEEWAEYLNERDRERAAREEATARYSDALSPFRELLERTYLHMAHDFNRQTFGNMVVFPVHVRRDEHVSE